MSDLLEIACPNCSKKYRVPDESIGKSVRCRSCQHAFKLEQPNTFLRESVAYTAPTAEEIVAKQTPPPLSPPLPTPLQAGQSNGPSARNQKMLAMIVAAIVLMVIVGVGILFLPKSHAQRMADEQGIAKSILVRFDETTYESSRKLQKVRNEIDSCISDARLVSLEAKSKKGLQAMASKMQATNIKLKASGFYNNAFDDAVLPISSAYPNSKSLLENLEKEKKISRETLMWAFRELDKLHDAWKADDEKTREYKKDELNRD